MIDFNSLKKINEETLRQVIYSSIGVQLDSGWNLDIYIIDSRPRGHDEKIKYHLDVYKVLTPTKIIDFKSMGVCETLEKCHTEASNDLAKLIEIKNAYVKMFGKETI